MSIKDKKQMMPWGIFLNKVGSAVVMCLAGTCLLLLWGITMFWRTEIDVVEFSEYYTLMPRFPLFSIGKMLVCAGILIAAAKLTLWNVEEQTAKRRARAISFCSALWIFLEGCLWTISAQPVPMADQKFVWEMAVDLAQRLPQRTAVEYFRCYPHQYGMAIFMEPFATLLKGQAVPGWGIIGSFFAAAAVLALCGITAQLGEDSETVVLCALLCDCFSPLAMYSSFVYGTIPGIALLLWAAYGVLRLCKGENPRWAVLLLLAPLGVLAYESMLVFVLALCIVLVFAGFKKGGGQLLMLFLSALLLLAVVLGAQILAGLSFEKRTGVEHYDGLPASAWIAMGVQADGVVGEGGYTGRFVEEFLTHDANTIHTNEYALSVIKETARQYVEKPERLSFFFRKTIRQWADGWFGAIIMVRPGDAAMAGFLARQVSGGRLYKPLYGLLNAHLSVVYLFASIGIVILVRRQKWQVWALFPVIVFLGGFLFQLVWETKSRYCLPYYLALVPVTAIGLAGVAETTRNLVKKD